MYLWRKKQKDDSQNLTLIWMSFLGVRFEVCVCAGRGEGGKLPRPPLLCLKFVRIMLETWNLARKYEHMYSFRNVSLSTKALLILLMSAFFAKNQRFFGQNSTFTQSNSVRAVLEIL